jgi:hypothetical protein
MGFYLGLIIRPVEHDRIYDDQLVFFSGARIFGGTRTHRCAGIFGATGILCRTGVLASAGIFHFVLHFFLWCTGTTRVALS